MNERIRELWRQAVLNNTKTPMNFQDAADEFAKMIVEDYVGDLEKQMQTLKARIKQLETTNDQTN
jgi:hypothetical protein